MTQRQTKQGVRALDPLGHNGRKNHGKLCRHWFTGAHIIIGTREVYDTDYWDVYEAPIYGQKCMWCPAVQELR